MNPKVDFYFKKAKNWQNEIQKLRAIVLDCGLTEELKWGTPCYTYSKPSSTAASKPVNIVLIHTFKEYCALLFFKGALLNDPNKILIQQSENVQAARQVRFTDLQEIVKKEKVLKAYIFQAIEVEKAGLKVVLKETKEFAMPDEFKKKLKAMPTLKKAFNELTPGRQRAYLLYFAAAKQTATRESRIEKYVKPILNGKGLND